MTLYHNHLATGYFGNCKTYKRIREHYQWKGMKKECNEFIQCCTTCYQTKYRLGLPLGEPHPLPEPTALWYNVMMNLITGLPRVGKYDTVCTVVDWFFKEIVVFPTTNAVSVQQIVVFFKDRVWSKHEAPCSIISNHRPQFMVRFMQELNRILGITTRLSLAWHPQTDRQMECMQQTWERYLRPYILESNWPTHLPTMKFMYNTMVHTSTGVLPFHLTYTYCLQIGFKPTCMQSEASKWTQGWKGQLEKACIQLQRVHECMIIQMQRKLSNICTRDFIWLSAQVLTLEENPKLLPKWLGPFKVMELHMNVCRLRLPTTIKIHPVFNVSYLKAFIPLHPTDLQWKVLQLVVQDGEFEVKRICGHQ